MNRPGGSGSRGGSPFHAPGGAKSLPRQQLQPTELQPRERCETHPQFYPAIAPNAAAAGTSHEAGPGGRPQLTPRKRLLEELVARLDEAFGGRNGPWPWYGSNVQVWRFPCPVCLGGSRGWAVDGPWRPLIVLSNGKVWCQASLLMSPELGVGLGESCRLTPDAPLDLLLRHLDLWERT